MVNGILLILIVLCLFIGNDTSEHIEFNGNYYLFALVLLTALIYRIFNKNK